MDNLSQMRLVLSYGVKNETLCGQWINFNSFTPDTNDVPNQIKYGFSETN
jgi:hypothetical protein